MKNKFTLLIAILTINIAISQTQAGLFSGVSFANIDSKDFYDSNAIGFNIGISSSTFLTEKSDFIIELGYEYKTFTPINYNDFNNQPIDTQGNSININNINVTALYNYYILTPDDYDFYLTAQAGLGSTVYNKWTSEDIELNSILESAGNFNPFYVIGTSIGLENFRVTLRYNKNFGNVLSEVSVLESNDNNSISDERYLNANMSYFSINLTYLTNFEF